LDRAWAGVDISKQHHAVVVDDHGTRVLSRRVANDQAALVELIGQVTELAGAVTWAVDLHSSEAALLVALLLAHDQTVVYVPGVMVNRAASAYRGAGKTDAKDAYVIAEQARMRRDLQVLRADDELIVELRLLVARRQDLRADRTRAVNRLHDRLVAVCPALERVLDLGNRGALVLLTGFQTPRRCRRRAWPAWRRGWGPARSAARASWRPPPLTRPMPRRSGCRVSRWPPA
jgi:transposase